MTDPEEELMEPSSSGSPPPAQDKGGKLFLGGLSWDTSEDKLREHFGQYGELLEVVVMRDKATGRPRGFGFVSFADPKVADTVVQETHIVDGRQIDAKKSVPQEQKPKARKIFVGGLSPETSEGEFQDYFGQFGEIAEVQIMQDHMSGRSRGFGFVTFEEDAAAERVFATGAMHHLGGKQVEVKPATPKGTGSQATRPSSARPGRPAGDYAGPHMMPYGAVPAASPYGAYGMYTYPSRGSMMPGTYAAAGFQGMQYPTVAPYMMMQQPQVGPYGMPTSPYAQYPPTPYSEGGGGGGSGRGGGGAPATPIPFPRAPFPSQPPPPAQHSPSSPYQARIPSRQRGGGRGSKEVVPQVDSASSLDQQTEQRLKKLSLD